MAQVIITESLAKAIEKKFRHESVEIFSLLKTLEENPKKGKDLGQVGGIAIRELKYKKFRLYFVTDGYKIKFLKAAELKDLVIKVVRLSEKKDQKKVIEEIRQVLRNLGEEGF